MSEILSNKISRAQQKSTIIGSNIEVINSELASLANVLSNLAEKYGDSNEIQKLIIDNNQLKCEIENAKQELFFAEIWNGIKQYQIPKMSVVIDKIESDSSKELQTPIVKKNQRTVTTPLINKNSSNVSTDDENEKYISQMLFKTGVIKTIEKHPDADSLYLEQIDVGEASTRTVISGLVAHFKPEELLNKKVILLCNLKPIKIRGIVSQGMVMCAVLGDKLETLEPPPGSLPGDKITFPGIKELNQYKEVKKEVFAKIAPYLKTNSGCVAVYNDKPFTIDGKGVIMCRTLVGAVVR